jgi:hypothetical protein
MTASAVAGTSDLSPSPSICPGSRAPLTPAGQRESFANRLYLREVTAKPRLFVLIDGVLYRPARAWMRPISECAIGFDRAQHAFYSAAPRHSGAGVTGKTRPGNDRRKRVELPGDLELSPRFKPAEGRCRSTANQ